MIYSIAPELAEDLQNLFAKMSPDDFRLMLEASIEANGATKLEVHRHFEIVDSLPKSLYTMKFI